MSTRNELPYEATHMVRDTCLCLHVQRAARTLARRFDEVLRQVEGAFSFVFMDENTLYAARDRYGGRPLAPADGGWTPIWAPSPLAFHAVTISRQKASPCCGRRVPIAVAALIISSSVALLPFSRKQYLHTHKIAIQDGIR